MRKGSVHVCLAILLMLAAFGCGRKASPPPARPAVQKPTIPLPAWAPKNPSPEFLRAARVLKPIPPEIPGRFGEQAGPAVQAILARYPGTYTPAWEFFGTLSDDEVTHLKSLGTVRVSVRKMTKTQRRILDSYFEAWGKAMAGQQQLPTDWLVELYKEGAKEDLSNVDAGFRRDSDRGVNIQFWITRSDGSVRTPSNTVAFM